MTEINVDLKDEENKVNEEQGLSPEEIAGIERAQQLGNVANQASAFRVPTEFVPIPSFGLVYHPNSPLYNIKEIEVRFMTAADEDILTSRSLLRSGKAIDAVLQSCIIDKRINAEELLSGDKNALITFLRVSGYGPDYKVEIDCPSCAETSKYEFDLSKLTMKFLDIEPTAAGENKFNFLLPSGVEVDFKLLNSAEDAKITEEQDKLKRTTNSLLERNVTTKYKHQIIAVNGNEEQITINNFVDTMNLRDSRAFRTFLEELEPDVNMEQDFKCRMCGHTEEVEIPVTTGFFWPES